MYRNSLHILYVSLDFFQIFKKIANIFFDFLKKGLIFKLKFWICLKNQYPLLRNMGLLDPKIKNSAPFFAPLGPLDPES